VSKEVIDTGAPSEPSSGADELVRELVARSPQVTSKGEFLALADRAQRALADRFAGAYGSSAFARLLALKVANLIVARHHFEHRHTDLASRPVQLMLDPANNCHLSCPGCVHTANPERSGQYDWPGGLLSPSVYAEFLRRLGPFGFGAVFYNYGEPLLNKQTPAMIRSAKNYLLHTCISTNFSLPIDADALIDCGLNFIFLSIDGATQEGYSRFRRGGDLALILANIRKLLAARERRGSKVPYVLWRFLTFEHNLAEVDEAIRIATDLGVDQISISTPFAVDWDDPSVRVARSEREGIYVLRPGATFKGPLDDWKQVDLPASEIDEQFELPWADRLAERSVEEPSRSGSSTCQWLYQSLTLDARGRVLPCCMPPEKALHRVYGSLPADGPLLFNEPDYRMSRLAFADRGEFDAIGGGLSSQDVPFCAICTANPEVTYALDRDVGRDLALLDSRGLLAPGSLDALTRWPRSR
jgi:MoaA/NifB/PqqE/SkfB family radical SAM enzyme